MAKSSTPPATGIDEGLLLAIISLIVSVLSGLVCVGQVVQQYIGTGGPIRLCDSIVYGGKSGLPGQGRRVWIWRQFRFRVLYEIPQISLVPLQPSVGLFVPFLIKPSPSFDWPPPDKKLMSDLPAFDNINAIGEASWVAFCRVLLQACPQSVIVNRVVGDTDRCPSDMTNIPMPISLRDLALFCLFVGMECTSASFESGTLSMCGPAGTITSAQHPTLGSCLHYAPPQDGFRLPRIGFKIDPTWILRACGRLRIGDSILIVGKKQPDAGASGLRSPFEDPREEGHSIDALAEKLNTLRHIPTSETKTITLAVLDFYWMSQMSVVAGFWATPFKEDLSGMLNMLWGASQVLLKVFIDLYYRDDDPPIAWADALPEVLCGENIITYPPYGLRHGQPGEMMSKETLQLLSSTRRYVDSPEFDGKIPTIMVRKESIAPSTHTRLEDHYSCSIEVMTIDIWLHVVSKTVPIMAGRKQILGKVPSMVQEVVTEYSRTFEGVALGTRSDLDRAARDLTTTLQALDLSAAENMYLLIALLRTVKVGLCIGLGNDTTPLLEIIEKDVQAHLL